MNATQLINSVVEGADPKVVVRKVLEGISGPERADLGPDEIAGMFQQLIQQSEAQVPYLDHQYVDMVLSQIRQGAPMDELIALAQKNREQYAGDAKIGHGGFDSWDVIHRSLIALKTDDLPPNAGM